MQHQLNQVILNGLNQPQDISRLSSTIMGFDGKVYIYIHPCFDRRRDGEPVSFGEQREVLFNLSRLGVPVIMFEECRHILNPQSLLNQHSGRLHLVKTHRGSSQPLYLRGNSYLGLDQSWQNICQTLEALGTRVVILSGQYLNWSICPCQEDIELAKDIQRSDHGSDNQTWLSLNPYHIPCGCVGNAAMHLAKQFQVQFTNCTFPEVVSSPVMV